MRVVGSAQGFDLVEILSRFTSAVDGHERYGP
jgi:hypothetical protein